MANQQFDDERVTRSLTQLLQMKEFNERLIALVGDATKTFGDLARAGQLANASMEEMNRILQHWPFRARLPRRVKKAVAKLRARRPLTRRERHLAQLAIARGHATLDELAGKSA